MISRERQSRTSKAESVSAEPDPAAAAGPVRQPSRLAGADQRYDRGWNTLLSLRSWALVGSSVMAIWTIRHPNMLIRWARRGFGVWSAWRLVKATIRQQQLR